MRQKFAQKVDKLQIHHNKSRSENDYSDALIFPVFMFPCKLGQILLLIAELRIRFGGHPFIQTRPL